jgi:hypothetical protein
MFLLNLCWRPALCKVQPQVMRVHARKLLLPIIVLSHICDLLRVHEAAWPPQQLHSQCSVSCPFRCEQEEGHNIRTSMHAVPFYFKSTMPPPLGHAHEPQRP